MPAPAHTSAPIRASAPTAHEASARRIELRGHANLPVIADVAESGRGDPVVFLHGLVGLNDHWENVVRRIDHTARCVLLQLPLLDLKSDDCSIHGVTTLTLKFLEQFHNPARGQAGAVLVGNSFGGHVALKIA